MNRQNKNKIGWCDYTWNPITGCKRGCSYCYGKRIRQRFMPEVPWSELMWHDERLEQPIKVKKTSKIFVGSMSDIEYWRKVDMQRVFEIIKSCPHHVFMFLTKNGEVYERYNFPENCWLGVTSVDGNYKIKAQKNRLMFISLEPLIKEPQGLWLNPLIRWLIIGGMTPTPVHLPIWIDNILKEADKLKIPVFVKHNAHYRKTREGFPCDN